MKPALRGLLVAVGVFAVLALLLGLIGAVGQWEVLLIGVISVGAKRPVTPVQ
ncbi:hypothetical protein ACIBG8_46600 [Nonomuraea sp. NPDC050556]|uniref:hypothetical protein n=1 Tax=Nonomuraea sp. NPDC050556 TaxID=3364369 RepID=UPI00379DDEF9